MIGGERVRWLHGNVGRCQPPPSGLLGCPGRGRTVGTPWVGGHTKQTTRAGEGGGTSSGGASACGKRCGRTNRINGGRRRRRCDVAGRRLGQWASRIRQGRGRRGGKLVGFSAHRRPRPVRGARWRGGRGGGCWMTVHAHALQRWCTLVPTTTVKHLEGVVRFVNILATIHVGLHLPMP